MFKQSFLSNSINDICLRLFKVVPIRTEKGKEIDMFAGYKREKFQFGDVTFSDCWFLYRCT